MAQARDWRGRFASGGGFSGGNSTRVRGLRHKEVSVTRLSKGTPTRPGRIGASLATNRFGKVGSPVNGNKNVRYVTRQHALGRFVGGPIGTASLPGGRAASALARRSPAAPKSGYIVQYSPRK